MLNERKLKEDFQPTVTCPDCSQVVNSKHSLRWTECIQPLGEGRPGRGLAGKEGTEWWAACARGVTAAGGGGGASEDPLRGLCSQVGDKTQSWRQTFHMGPSGHRAAR